MTRKLPWNARNAKAIFDGCRWWAAYGAAAEGPAAFLDLRIGRRRQVDLDRAFALRLFPGPRRPDGDFAAGVASVWHCRRRPRFFLVAGRARGRAPTKDHDRCRLSVFRDPGTGVRGGRYPGTRAVHTQYGDRRLGLRAR